MIQPPLTFSQERGFPITRAQAWELLANTEHLNRIIRLPSVTYGNPDSDGLWRPASAKLFGMVRMRWKEFPFEWVRDERYAVERIYENGPLRRFYGGVELRDDTNGGTIVRVFADLTPRHVIGRIIASVLGKKGVRDTLDYVARFLATRQAHQKPDADAPRNTTRGPVNGAELEKLTKQLLEAPVAPALVTRLRQRLMDGTDEEVLRMRPFAIAELWQADRDEVLKLFLHATQRGMLNLAWEMVCPNCRVPKAEFTALADLPSAFHCDLCGIAYDADFDQSVELRFSAHPAIREATDAVYCLGGPANTPHIVAQQSLVPGQTRELVAPLSATPMRVRVLRHNHASRLRCVEHAHAPEIVKLRHTGKQWQTDEHAYRAGATRLMLRNDGDKAIMAVVEHAGRDRLAATATYVTTLQEFSRMFGSEVLSRGTQVAVNNINLLFSDLKKSTELYEQVGEADAYGRVRRHFSFLEEIIGRNHGRVVKTMGDAVMAVFWLAQDAVQTALEIQAGIAAFNRKHALQPSIIIKIGVHRGPAIAVNANDKLDYFGRTVNIAARVQGESEGDDVVLTRILHDDPAVQHLLQRFNFNVEPRRATLKGIVGEFDLYRLRLNPSAGRPS